jgi:hypothetical protein
MPSSSLILGQELPICTARDLEATRWLTLRLECIRRLAGDAGCAIVAVSAIVFAVVVLATSLALVAGLAWASRRLLGLPVGALRALIAGLLGFAAAYLLGRALQAAQPGHLAAFITVAVGVPLVVAMIFLVVAEALVPSGMLPQPWR